jgi:vacuolar-type H+-ATPase subunit H
MEKVWEELKKIEGKAKQINSDTLKRSEELITIAKKDAEKLLSLSRKHTEAEVNELLNKVLKEDAKEREAALEKNEKTLQEMREMVEKNFAIALDTVFNAVLGKVEL